MAALPILPTYVRTAADLTRVVTLGSTPESIVLEFKEDLPPERRATKDAIRREAQKELCRDIAQFANTLGGCILYGVAEQEIGGAKVAGELAPITDFDGYRDWLQQSVRNFLVPATLTLHVERIEVAGGRVMAVNVPPSLHLVSLWDREHGTIECLYRTNHGKAHMNPDEAERHLMNGSRAKWIAFTEAVQDCGGGAKLAVDIVSGVVVRELWGGGSEVFRRVPHTARLAGFHPKQITLGITVANDARPTLNVPMGLVREVWPVQSGVLGVMLDAQIVWDGGTKTVSLSSH